MMEDCDGENHVHRKKSLDNHASQGSMEKMSQNLAPAFMVPSGSFGAHRPSGMLAPFSMGYPGSGASVAPGAITPQTEFRRHSSARPMDTLAPPPTRTGPPPAPLPSSSTTTTTTTEPTATATATATPQGGGPVTSATGGHRSPAETTRTTTSSTTSGTTRATTSAPPHGPFMNSSAGPAPLAPLVTLVKPPRQPTDSHAPLFVMQSLSIPLPSDDLDLHLLHLLHPRSLQVPHHPFLASQPNDSLSSHPSFPSTSAGGVAGSTTSTSLTNAPLLSLAQMNRNPLVASATLSPTTLAQSIPMPTSSQNVTASAGPPDLDLNPTTSANYRGSSSFMMPSYSKQMPHYNYQTQHHQQLPPPGLTDSGSTLSSMSLAGFPRIPMMFPDSVGNPVNTLVSLISSSNNNNNINPNNPAGSYDYMLPMALQRPMMTTMPPGFTYPSATGNTIMADGVPSNMIARFPERSAMSVGPGIPDAIYMQQGMMGRSMGVPQVDGGKQHPWQQLTGYDYTGLHTGSGNTTNTMKPFGASAPPGGIPSLYGGNQYSTTGVPPMETGRNRCPICGKVFKRPLSLQIHFSIHTGEKMFRCEWQGCGRLFNVKSNMKRHYRLHLRRENERGYEGGV